MPLLLRTRETVAVETPARFATSKMFATERNHKANEAGHFPAQSPPGTQRLVL